MKDQHELPIADSAQDKKRRTQGGQASTDVVVSAYQADNASVFPGVLKLHVPMGAVVADITYGKGVFWKNVPRDHYTVLASDLKIGLNWNNLPYEDDSVDAIVFDPPYMEGLYRSSSEALAGSGTHVAFQDAYSNSATQKKTAKRKYHDAVLESYLSVLPGVKRILKCGGEIYSQVSR